MTASASITAPNVKSESGIHIAWWADRGESGSMRNWRIPKTGNSTPNVRRTGMSVRRRLSRRSNCRRAIN